MTLADICQKYSTVKTRPNTEPVNFDIVSGIDIHNMKHWGQYTGIKNCNGYRVIVSQGFDGTTYKDETVMLKHVEVLFSPSRTVRVCNANANQ